MPRRKQLTREQVRSAIARLILDRGTPPTIEELKRALGVGSKRTVLRYLQWLEEEGDIERWPGARGLRLRRAAAGDVETRAIPVVGEAPAGALMAAEQNVEGWVRVFRQSLNPRATYFLLRVRGDSMNRAQVDGGCIENGDLVLVRQQATAEPGSIVVALIDGQATIKRLVGGSGYYVLKPESTTSSHQPIIVDQEFRVQGVVCRVIKAGAKIINDET